MNPVSYTHLDVYKRQLEKSLKRCILAEASSLTVFDMGFQLLDRPIVMAGRAADKIRSKRAAADPGIGTFGKQLFVGERFRQRHDGFVRCV